MQVPADEWQSKMEASVKEVKKLEDHYVAKCQSLGVSMVFFMSKINSDQTYIAYMIFCEYMWNYCIDQLCKFY